MGSLLLTAALAASAWDDRLAAARDDAEIDALVWEAVADPRVLDGARAHLADEIRRMIGRTPRDERVRIPNGTTHEALRRCGVEFDERVALRTLPESLEAENVFAAAACVAQEAGARLVFPTYATSPRAIPAAEPLPPWAAHGSFYAQVEAVRDLRKTRFGKGTARACTAEVTLAFTDAVVAIADEHGRLAPPPASRSQRLVRPVEDGVVELVVRAALVAETEGITRDTTAESGGVRFRRADPRTIEAVVPDLWEFRAVSLELRVRNLRCGDGADSIVTTSAGPSGEARLHLQLPAGPGGEAPLRFTFVRAIVPVVVRLRFARVLVP